MEKQSGAGRRYQAGVSTKPGNDTMLRVFIRITYCTNTSRIASSIILLLGSGIKKALARRAVGGVYAA
jgi:hypothetical protein